MTVHATSGMQAHPAIAVLIPCYNEAATIAAVVRDFRTALPEAVIYVFDNNSTDDTPAIAASAGAIVRHEPQQGKGRVIRRMFADIEADIYVLVDGDDTYEAAAAPAMVDMLRRQSLDMVTGCRVASADKSYPVGHAFGNALITGVVTTIFGRRTRDMLSGYRVFSRRFVKSFPALAAGFETETEFTVHALELKMPIGCHDTVYGERPEGSESKLSTFRDGSRIALMIFNLLRAERPFALFGAIGLLLALLSIALGTPIVVYFLKTGLVERFPTAILASAIMVIAFLNAMTGVVLDSVAHGRREVKRLHYLRLAAPPLILDEPAP